MNGFEQSPRPDSAGLTPTRPNSPWHLVVHGKPTAAIAGANLALQEGSLRTLDLQGAPASAPLPVRFEAAFADLERLGLFIEGDGSFCWTAPQAIWRIFGELYDGGDRLHYAELKGTCPAVELRQILSALGLGQGALMLQMVREGVYVEVEEFFAWAFPES
jgi:hypothetical protein